MVELLVHKSVDLKAEQLVDWLVAMSVAVMAGLSVAEMVVQLVGLLVVKTAELKVDSSGCHLVEMKVELWVEL